MDFKNSYESVRKDVLFNILIQYVIPMKLVMLMKMCLNETNISRYTLDLVGVQEVRWDKRNTVRVGAYKFFYGKGKENHQLGTGFSLHHSIV